MDLRTRFSVMSMMLLALGVGACSGPSEGSAQSVLAQLHAATIPRAATDVDLQPLERGETDVRASWSFKTDRPLDSYREWVVSRLADYECDRSDSVLVFRRTTTGDAYNLSIRAVRSETGTNVEASFRGLPH